MNHCTDLDRRLADYLAGRLDPTAAAALEDHAGACDRCAALLEEATRPAVDLAPEVAPPAAVRASVMARVTRASRRRERRWLVPTAIAATLVIGFALTRPAPKRAMVPRSANPALIAAARADGEFERLAMARREVEAALRDAPGDPELEAALARLDSQRRQLEHMVLEFES